MTKRNSMFWFRIIVLALAIAAMVLSIITATERSITITRAALMPDGAVYVTYRYILGPEHQMKATAYSYGGGFQLYGQMDGMSGRRGDESNTGKATGRYTFGN